MKAKALSVRPERAHAVAGPFEPAIGPVGPRVRSPAGGPEPVLIEDSRNGDL